MAEAGPIAFAKLPETTGNVAVKAPQTGAEYLASLADDRAVFIYGERVKDVTKHPAFRNTAKMVARLYDALHDPARKDKLLLPTEEIRRYCLFGAMASGNADKFKGFAEECMAEYDLDGWKVPDLTDPGELSYHVMRGPAGR